MGCVQRDFFGGCSRLRLGAKSGADGGAQEVEEESSCDCRADEALEQMARHGVDDVCRDLNRNDDRCEEPAPTAATKPAGGGHPQTKSEKKEGNSDDWAEWY